MNISAKKNIGQIIVYIFHKYILCDASDSKK